jgi:ribose 5-phosphate isomerase B
MTIKVAIASDHAGFDYKTAIKEILTQKGFEMMDFGAHSTDSMDYPDVAHPLADEVNSGNASFGILICGSGNGVCMTANKHQGIRAALCWNKELGELARLHNNANVLCLPARFIGLEEAIAICEAFLATAFEGGRHENRVNKINC